MKSYFTVLCFLMLFIAAIFTTSFAQLPWTKDANNPILSGGASGTWDRHVMMPSVLYNADSSRYEMWYCGSVGSPNWRPYQIGFAVSDDGISWTKLNTSVLSPTPGTWDESTVEEPMVIHENGQYKMWYTGWNPDTMGIGYATSPDGINWTKHANNPVVHGGTDSWEAGGLAYCSVIHLGGDYKMWYTGFNADYTALNIGYATSNDGIAWTKADELNPVLTSGLAGQWDSPRIMQPQVILLDSVYHLWYTGSQGQYEPRKIGWATSVDGIHWSKYNKKTTTSILYADSDPVLRPSSGQWDASNLEIGTVMHEGNSLRMWYSGWRDPLSTYLIRTGHATAPLAINVPGNFETIQAAIDAAHDGNIVLVDEGTYYENINFKGKAITVASYFYFDSDTSHISNTIIDGSQPSNPDSGSVVYFVSGEDTTSVLYGLTITGGSGTYWPGFDAYGGGGVLMEAGGKVLHNKITGNHLISQKGCWGAGMAASSYNMSGNIVIEHNDFNYNSILSPEESGCGGIHIPLRWWTGGYCRVKNNTISYNSVTCTGTYKAVAGGIMLAFSLPTVGEVIVESNIVSHNELHCVASIGAGIYVVYFEPGGTIIDNNPTPLISNNIITNNYSQDKGGGLGVWTVENNHQSNSVIDPQPAFINNTIMNNSAKDGCGLFNYDSYPLLLNNILWDDLSESGSREIFNDDIDYPEYWDHINNGDVFVFNSDIQCGWPGETNIDVYPAFEDTSNNDFSLTESSPCVGSGTDSLFVENIWYRSPVTDYFGDPRPNPVDNYVDMGAIESSYIISDILKNGESIPYAYNLKQNYPNPFNPITMISYQLPMTNEVELIIYNLLGQKVKTLVSEKQKAGHHQVEWNASGFASGIYYYSLTAGEFQDVKKMILLR